MEVTESKKIAVKGVPQGDSRKALEKKKRKLPRAAVALPRQPVTDGRRTYAQLLLNAFNSCDISKVRNVLEQYCVPELYSVCLYDGTKNPYAAESTEVRTIEGHITMWSALFTSAPDFLFEGEFQEAYFDPNTKLCVVRSKFVFHGTRVMDVKIAEVVNDKVIKEKLMKKEQYTTDENELMAQIHEQLAASYSASGEESLNIEDPVTALEVQQGVLDDSCWDTPCVKAPVKEKNSIFEPSCINLDGLNFYVDPTPLAQSLTMNCSGTLTVFLNKAHKIVKYEFLYVAMVPS